MELYYRSKYLKYHQRYFDMRGAEGEQNLESKTQSLKRQESDLATHLQKKSESNKKYYKSAQYFINYLYSRPYIFQSPSDCFFSGSFVFSDQGHKFYNFIKKNYFHGYFPTPKATHIGFKKNKNITIHGLNKRLGVVKALEISLNPPVYLDCTHTESNCLYNKPNIDVENIATLEKQKKGVILMYRFTYKDPKTKEARDYTFFKLEAHKQFSLAHIKGAKNRYYTGEKKQSRLVRREDSFKDCKYVKTGSCQYKIKTVCPEGNKEGTSCQIHCNSKLGDKGVCGNQVIANEASFYDIRIRLGSEYYVPQLYTQTLLQEFPKCRRTKE